MIFRRILFAVGIACFVTGFGASSARAADDADLSAETKRDGGLPFGWSISARTIYHGYQLRLRDPSDADALRQLHQFYQTLDGGMWGLTSENLDIAFSMRFKYDFGTGYRFDTGNGAPIPKSEAYELDLSYFYVEYRDAIPGILDVMAGRLLQMDVLNWYTFDGLKGKFHLGADHMIELYIGRTVPFDALFSAEPFLNDGVRINDGEHLVYGGGWFGQFGRNLSVALAYRQEYIFRNDEITPFGWDPNSTQAAQISDASGGKIGVQQWLIGGNAAYTVDQVGLDVYASWVYNILFTDIDEVRGGLSWNPRPGIHVGAEYLRSRPRFAGDSIFNYFNTFAYDGGRLEADWEIIEGLLVQGAYGLRLYRGDVTAKKSSAETTGGGDSFTGSDFSHVFQGGVRYDDRHWGVGAFGEVSTNLGGEFAYGGNFRRLEISGYGKLWHDRISLNARLGIDGAQDDWYTSEDVQVSTAQNEGPIDGSTPSDENVSYSVDVGGSIDIIENITYSVLFVKRFDSALAGDYRLYSELEVRY